MSKELNRHVKGDKIKWIFSAIAFLLVMVLLVGIIMQVFATDDKYKPSNWFNKSEQTEENDDTTNGGSIIIDKSSKGVKLMSAEISKSDYETYGVSSKAESAYSVTASVYPEDAANQNVDFSVSFANSASAWASGKTVTDYVNVIQSNDGSFDAIIEKYKPFGEQIIVNVVSRSNSSAKASCTIEYQQRIEGYTFAIGDNTFTTGGTTTGTVTPDLSKDDNCVSPIITTNKSSVYTKENSSNATYYTIKPTDELKSVITNAGLDGSKLRSYSGYGLSSMEDYEDIEDYFDYYWGSSVFGSNGANMNKFIRAISGFSGNAYDITIYTEYGGTQVATFTLTLDTSTIANQIAVESVALDYSQIIF
jgi:hypothetical protein